MSHSFKTKLKEIWIYPIKGLAGIRLSSAWYDHSGLENDRKYMLVDQENRFISQRSHPSLVLFKTQILAEGILVSFEGDSILIDAARFSEQSSPFQLFKDAPSCFEADKPYNTWFSSKLNEEIRLVKQNDSNARVRSRKNIEFTNSLSDGYPLLLANEQSLISLNSQSSFELSMSRFRPNLIIDDVPAWEEICCEEIEIDRQVSRITKACTRCSVTNVDPQLGSFGTENVLAKLKELGNGTAVFGLNVVFEGRFKIESGNELILRHQIS